MRFDKNLLKKRWVSYTVALCIAVILYLTLSNINIFFTGISAFLDFIYPVFLGLIIAYIMDPLVMLYQKNVFQRVSKNTIRRNLSVVAAVITVLAGIIFLMVALIPQIVNSISTFVGNIETYAKSLQKLLKDLENLSSSWKFDLSSVISQGEDMVEKLLADMPKNLNAILDTTVSFGKSIASWVIGAIFAIYFLIDKDRLKNAGSKLLRSFVLDRTYRNYVVFWERSNQILIRYIVYDVLDGLIIGVTNWFFMAVADMPYGLLISVVVGVTNLAPTFGPIVGGAIGAFILVLINPWYALTFLIFTIVLQTVDGYILKPKLFAATLGVSGVWILICIVVGGRMFGVGGILLAIPFAAIMDYIYKESILVSLAERKARREEWYSAENEKKEEKTDQIDGEEDSSEEEDTDVEEADVDDVEAEDAEAEDVGDPE
uniref:Putative permease n=1 Tax=Eubacterium cellulosolvens (strain ATCC 43171 / JCM 9499 / 6) TaxID=633697 RepID=I5ATB9_EUBC6